MLSLVHLNKSFPLTDRSNTILFKNLEFSIDTGEFAVLLGSNGSGKSTLLKLIAGFLSPDSGSIILEGLDITKQPAFKRAESIYYLHQTREQNLSPSITVLDAYMIGLAPNNGLLQILNPKSWKEEVIHILSQFNLGLQSKIDQQIKTLSGGEHQLIALSLIVERAKRKMNANPILLLDEHTAHLDARMSDIVMDITNRLIKENKITTLMVTHNLFIARDFGDKTYFLNEGEISLINKSDILNLFDKRSAEFHHDN